MVTCENQFTHNNNPQFGGYEEYAYCYGPTTVEIPFPVHNQTYSASGRCRTTDCGICNCCCCCCCCTNGIEEVACQMAILALRTGKKHDNQIKAPAIWLMCMAALPTLPTTLPTLAAAKLKCLKVRQVSFKR